MRRNRDPCNPWSAALSLPFRKLAVFTTATSGAPPERSDATPIHGRVTDSRRPTGPDFFSVANRRQGFLVLLDASGNCGPDPHLSVRAGSGVCGIYDRHTRRRLPFHHETPVFIGFAHFSGAAPSRRRISKRHGTGK